MRHDIDLDLYIRDGRIQVFSHSAADLQKFRSSFDPMYVEKLDDGETESLIHLISPDCEDFLLCSGDAIVFRVLGNLQMTEKGISLEEVFDRFGWRRNLEPCFLKSWRQRWSQIGLADSMYGGGKQRE